MPFTLAHSAAVLPFFRSRYFSITGLVVGSMAPDFEYFIRMNVKGIYSHTLWGLLYFNIPVSIALAFLFHEVVKYRLIDSLPTFLQSRFQDIRRFDFKSNFKAHPLVFIYSCLLGAITHIFWDSFTHNGRWFVTHLSMIYEGRFVTVNGVHYPLWYALQHISTYVGLLILMIYVLRIKPVPGQYSGMSWIYWISVVVITSLVVLIRFQFPIGVERLVYAAITMISGICIAFTLLGLVNLRKIRESRPEN